MATISTLAVNLIARTSAFEKGMRRGKKSVKTFKTSLVAMGKRMAMLGSVVATTGLIIGKAFVKNTLASLDVVAKLSRRLDIAHESLLGLQHAASLAGVTNEALNKSLEIFVRRMGEVKMGSGEATRGLEALGLSAEKMIKMSPEKSLLIIADRIQELGTQAEKSAAAYFLFGRSGAQLLNLFEQGADGIERAQDEARRLGITLEGLDLSKIEAANDAANSMAASFKSMGQSLTVKIAPTLEKISKILTNIIGDDPLEGFRTIGPDAPITDEAKRLNENLKTIEGIRKEIEIAGNLPLWSRRDEILKELNKRLVALTKEKKLAESIAVTEKKRLETNISLMARVQAEAQNIMKNVFNKLGNNTEAETGGGRFQQIRTSLIDVAALNPAKNPTTELQLLNKKTDTTNELLRIQINGGPERSLA